jgi:hypothetical protein
MVIVSPSVKLDRFEDVRSRVMEVTPALGHEAPRHAHAVRLESEVRGDAIAIVEPRPAWREDLGPERTRPAIAQLRY